ncbi:major facilitator superfamily transporter [Pyrenophora seminiperda CCB06]|uniref:Major facilitator superfamily transporter n=1 Tax=Pyrenophora seminiperda CCB06 TaxID=1302712 RepID=A0A3M7MCE9_9PLEO|nr:major facilitator superfamily transporter [Pyrenophora seminiperda CCB06]
MVFAVGGEKAQYQGEEGCVECNESEKAVQQHSLAMDHVSTTPTPPPPPYSAFSVNRQRFILAVVTAAGFFGPLCGAIYLPSLKLFQHTVYIVGLGSFIIANTLLAVLPAHLALLYLLRVFQAFGSCIVYSVGAGTIADITEPARRASALSWFLMGPQLGPLLGPFIGGQFATESRWRWVFGFLSLASLPVYLAIVFCIPETLRSLVGDGTALANQPWFSIPNFRTKPCTDSKTPKAPRPSFQEFIRLLRYPPHLIVSFNGAIQFAGVYGMYISFPTIWQEGYHWSSAEVGYGYLCPGIAMFITAIPVGWLSDHMRKTAMANSPDGKVAPESRVSVQIPGLLIAAAGKIMFGWSTQKHVHPAAGLFGSFLAGVGASMATVVTASFQTECDPTQAASAVALGAFLRNFAAAICAAVMASILRSMGWGWAFTGLGILDLACIPGVVLIMVRGAKFREAWTQQVKRGAKTTISRV